MTRGVGSHRGTDWQSSGVFDRLAIVQGDVRWQPTADHYQMVKKLALDQLSGLTNAQPQALSRVNALQTVEPGDVEKWVSQSQTQNPGVLQSNIALDVARLETEKAKAAHQPTVDLTASYAQTRYQNPSASQFNTDRKSVV